MRDDLCVIYGIRIDWSLEVFAVVGREQMRMTPLSASLAPPCVRGR